MKYSLSSITARIPGLARTENYGDADAGLRTLLIKGSVGTFSEEEIKAVQEFGFETDPTHKAYRAIN